MYISIHNFTNGQKNRAFTPKKSYKINKKTTKTKKRSLLFLKLLLLCTKCQNWRQKIVPPLQLLHKLPFFSHSLTDFFWSSFSFLQHPHALRFPPPKRPSARTHAHTHRHQARMRAPIELFSHSALVFLLGFAARIVVLVLCVYTFLFGGFGLY
jgi:hypothetical protein